MVGTGRVPIDMMPRGVGLDGRGLGGRHRPPGRRGLGHPDGRLTSDGMAPRITLEDVTDRAATWRGRPSTRTSAPGGRALRPVGALLSQRVPIRVPNPMGWEPVGSWHRPAEPTP